MSGTQTGSPLWDLACHKTTQTPDTGHHTRQLQRVFISSLKGRPEMKRIRLFCLVLVLMFITVGCKKKEAESPPPAEVKADEKLTQSTEPARQPGSIDKAKWMEATVTAGTIRSAVRAYAAETSVNKAQALAGTDLSIAATQSALGISAASCDGAYFTAGDYTITAVNANGFASITVTGGSKADSPGGTYVLQEDGK